MTFGKVLEEFKSRFQNKKAAKELFLIDKKSGKQTYTILRSSNMFIWCVYPISTLPLPQRRGWEDTLLESTQGLHAYRASEAREKCLSLSLVACFDSCPTPCSVAMISLIPSPPRTYRTHNGLCQRLGNQHDSPWHVFSIAQMVTSLSIARNGGLGRVQDPVHKDSWDKRKFSAIVSYISKGFLMLFVFLILRKPSSVV